jgi:hypothetical protein
MRFFATCVAIRYPGKACFSTTVVQALPGKASIVTVVDIKKVLVANWRLSRREKATREGKWRLSVE